MKIVALIASYNRDMILRDCLQCIMPQVDDVVLVGSSSWCEGEKGSSVEKKIAKELGLVYVDHRNIPLGQKWQAGLNRCRELNPDAVLICGSDDLLSKDWIYFFTMYNIKDIPQLSGAYQWAIYNPIINEMFYAHYINRIDPIGAGRLILKEALDNVDWQIFPSEAVGCDLYSYRILNCKTKSTEIESRQLLCVKGSWGCLDSWQQILSSENLNIETPGGNYEDEPETISLWLNKYFPEIDFEKYRSIS